MIIDLMLAGDNAIIVGMAAAGLPREQRRRVVMLGIAAATVLRIALATVAVSLLAIIGLTLAGGVLLLWVAWRLYRELRAQHAPEALSMPGGRPPKTFAQAVFQIVLGGAIVLAVGRLAAQKRFGLLLDAAARWGDIRPAPLLVLVGQGPLAAELQARAASLGLTIRFAGQRPDVPALLSAADVFVLPSVWEGQALILQEALRAGVPIVATRVGGNPELTGEDAAILVPPGDAQRLADAVRAVLGDPAVAARLREAAAARARALPDEDAAVAAALAEYRHVAP